MKSLTLFFFATATLLAQSAGATFEAANIKFSPPNDGNYSRGCNGGPGAGDPILWRCTNATIGMLVMRAYDVKRYQLTAPDWTANMNYEIVARLPPGATKEEFREMIRNLLSSRFKLEFHWSKKEIAMYDLVAVKGGPKLKESADRPTADANAGQGARTDAEGYPIIPKDCNGCMSVGGGKARYQASKSPVRGLADMIESQLGVPVNDQTGLTGKYDITLSWSAGGGIGRRPDEDADPGVTIETAMQQQLGLKLVSKKGLVDIIVVDKAERDPGEN